MQLSIESFRSVAAYHGPRRVMIGLTLVASLSTAVYGQSDSAELHSTPTGEMYEAGESTRDNSHGVDGRIDEVHSGGKAVGHYGQPAWTARSQRFATTSAYVLPHGFSEVEAYTITTLNNDHKPEIELLQELKIGLPHRFEFDVFATQVDTPESDGFNADKFKFELRYAPADWDEIPLNPTFVVKYETVQDKDKNAMQYKLLLADDLASQWQWAGNLFFKDSFSEDEIKYGLSTGVNYAFHERFGIGAELKAYRKEHHDKVENRLMVGPSLEWRPGYHSSLRLVPMVGIGPDSPDARIFAIFGIGFGGH